MSEKISYNLEFIKEYQRLSEENDSQKISFYKKNEEFFDLIPINKKLDILRDFLESLFHNGDYADYLQRCDHIVAALFDSALFPEFHKEYVTDLLYMKACSLFNMHQGEKSLEVLKDLIKLDQSESLRYKDLLFRIFKKKRSLKKFQARGIVIAFILTSAILSIWMALFVKNHQPELLPIYQSWALGLFLTGLFIWLGFVMWNSFMSYRSAQDFISK